MDAQSLFPTLRFGGDGGGSFDDVLAAAPGIIVGIQSITIRSGSAVDAIQVNYVLSDGSTYAAPRHGGTGGHEHKSTFQEGETIVIVEGRSGSRLDQIKFTTRLLDGSAKVYGPYGGDGGSPFVIQGYALAFFGRSGSRMDAIGMYLTSPSSALYGGTGGAWFSDPCLVEEPEIVGIKSIYLRSGSEVDAIQVTYVRQDGSTYQGPMHGGSGGSPATIELEPEEKLLAVVGRSGSSVDQLNFLTITESGQRKTYGPYGGNGGNQFILNAEAVGIFGRSGSKLDAIGFYLAYPEDPDIVIYGADGYRYCVLQHTATTRTCTVPVQAGATDLNFVLSILGGDANSVGFQVKSPSGVVYTAASGGTGGIWAVNAGNPSLGLASFYIQNPMAGTWQAIISCEEDVEWSLIGTTNPASASVVARDAFGQMTASQQDEVYGAIGYIGGELPPEFCYFCQAQAIAIMGLAVATFVFWAGPVTASSAVVLYAERLLGTTAASLVASINKLYELWKTGQDSWNLARTLCEMEGFCA